MKNRKTRSGPSRLSQDGDFDAASVRREFTLPEFFTKAEDISRNGLSHPVTDIAFPALSGENTMVLAERGGLLNLGLNSGECLC